ncbi:hypothetical protein ELY11_05790 [Legionella septentrionalis]|nr:hypothetical protein ELY11_05790 [Legionella septentrionalis]
MRPMNDGSILREVRDADIKNGTFDIPESVRVIDWGAFSNHINLKKLDVPEGVTHINPFAFSGCRNLTQIDLPESLTTIERCTFEGCSSLTKINWPKNVAIIPVGTFIYCCSLTEINVPEGVTHIGDSAFKDCINLTKIYLPKSLTDIGAAAFAGCNNLTEINVPEGVARIGASAFKGCINLTKICLPKGLTDIDNTAFVDCNKLAHIIISSDDEKEITHIKSLLPKELHNKVSGRADYDRAQQKVKSALESAFLRSELKPLYPFMIRKESPFYNEDTSTVVRIENSDYYKFAREDMENIPIPENEAQIQAYQEKLDDIAERYLNEAKNEARKQVEHQYQESIKLYPEQIKNFSSTDIKKTREKYPLLSEEESGKYLDAFNRFHQCCAELSKKHSDFVTRDEKAATRGTHELLNTLQLAYMDYMKDAREIEEKSKLSERAKAFRQTCQEAIDKATPELEKHRGVKKILTNLAIALVTLGTAFVVNYALTGRFFFHPATASEKILNKASKAIEEIDIPALKQEPKKGT